MACRQLARQVTTVIHAIDTDPAILDITQGLTVSLHGETYPLTDAYPQATPDVVIENIVDIFCDYIKTTGGASQHYSIWYDAERAATSKHGYDPDCCLLTLHLTPPTESDVL